MKLTQLAIAVLSLSLFAPLAAFAQDAMVKGEVKKVDAAGGKITMTSGPIKNLDMEDDNMTMVFRVQDPAILKQVKPGRQGAVRGRESQCWIHDHQTGEGKIRSM